MPRSNTARANPRPAGRGAMSLGAPRVRTANGTSNVTELFDLGGRFEPNELTRAEIDKLRSMIAERGAYPVAKELGLVASTLLYATSGFGHRLAHKTAERLREYLR